MRNRLKFYIPIILLEVFLLISINANASVGSFFNGKSDDVTGAIRTIEVEHAEIHEGNHFIACNYNADVDAAYKWRITAPNTSTRVHLRGILTSSLNGVVQLYVAPTITGAGTAFSARNNDGNSSNLPTTVFAYGATTSSDGTLAFSQVIGSDGLNANGSAGGTALRSEEIILAQGQTYLMVYTPVATNNRVSVCFEFYEED